MTDRPLTFEPTRSDGSPRLTVGIHRPIWPINPNGIRGYVNCTCGHVLQTTEAVIAHWQEGHFDRPVYEADDD